MNGKQAKRLRKQLDYKPTESRNYTFHDKLVDYDKEVVETVTKEDGTTEEVTTYRPDFRLEKTKTQVNTGKRAKYQALKKEFYGGNL